MALADLFADPPPVGTRGPECAMGRILRALDDADRAAVVAALANPAWQGTVLARRLTDAGHAIASQTLNRHRKGDCQCQR